MSNVFVNLVWNRLMQNKRSPDPITIDEEKQLKRSITEMFVEGWGPTEIVKYLEWTEYFNTADTEEYCLQRMTEQRRNVAKRLNTTKSDLF